MTMSSEYARKSKKELLVLLQQKDRESAAALRAEKANFMTRFKEEAGEQGYTVTRTERYRCVSYT